MSLNEEIILQLVRTGFFTIDKAGRIWKNQEFTRSGHRRQIHRKPADTIKQDGYRSVRVSIKGKEICALAHRIVWISLNGVIPEGYEINHKDGVRSNNDPSNIELATKSENLLHAYRELGRFRASGEKNGRSKLTYSEVLEIRRRCSAGESRRSLGRLFGVSHVTIRKIVSGKSWLDEFPVQDDGR